MFKKRILIVGLGRFGKALVRALNDPDKWVEVIAVDANAEAVKEVMAEAEEVVRADPKDRGVLETLCRNGVDTAIIATSKKVGESALATMILKDLGVPEVIARAESDHQEELLKKLGADRIVEPITHSAELLATALASGSILDFLVADENFAVVKHEVGTEMDGETLLSLEFRRRFDVSVVTILRQPEQEDAALQALVPDPELPLRKGDVLLVVGRTRDLKRFGT